MIFHHLLQEKMTVWKQVRFRNLLFSHGSQALFSTIFQENQQRFLFVTVFSMMRWFSESPMTGMTTFFLHQTPEVQQQNWMTGGRLPNKFGDFGFQKYFNKSVNEWTKMWIVIISFCWIFFESNMISDSSPWDIQLYHRVKVMCKKRRLEEQVSDANKVLTKTNVDVPKKCTEEILTKTHLNVH